MKKIINMLLVAIMLFSAVSVCAAEMEPVVITEKGKTFFEAEKFLSTDVPEAHYINQTDYMTEHSEEQNKGCIALMGERNITYLVDVKKKGNYTFSFYSEDPVENKSFSVVSNGAVLGNVSMSYRKDGTSSGDTTILRNVPLEAGVQELTVRGSGNSIIFLYYFTVENSAAENTGAVKSEGSYRDAELPAKIQAEDFDLGAAGSLGNNASNDGGLYRPNDPIDIYKDSSERFYITLNANEYVNYTFDVKYSGAYKLFAAASVGGKIDVYTDDIENSVSARLASGDTFPETEIASFWFDKGTHKIKLTSESSVSIDYLRFETTDGEYITAEQLKNQNKNEEKPANVFKELYVSQNGSDEGSGSKESPFKTISRAKKEISAINKDMNGDIVVYIGQGIYKLDETEIFTTADGGKNGYRVIFKAEDIFNRPVISGGRKIEGWEKSGEVLWSAPLENIEYVRNLYINTLPAVPARSKYVYDFRKYYKKEAGQSGVDGLIVSTINFPKNFEHPEGMELVWNSAWVNNRGIVTDIIYNNEEKEATILLKTGVLNWLADPSQADSRIEGGFYIENALELLDEPGEFYYNKEEKRIYYYPYSYEDMTTADTYIGETENLVKIYGNSPEDKVENMSFENLIFRYGAYDFISRYGHTSTQSDGITGTFTSEDGKNSFSPQFDVKMADGIKIKNCEFSCLGSSAIGMTDGVSNAEISGSLFRDAAGGAVTVGHLDHEKYIDGMEVCENIKITDNVIRRVADEQFNCCGISVYTEKNIEITHNTFMDLPYTGVSAGWGWELSNPYNCGNMDISYNYFDSVMCTLNDGGHIYTLGQLKNTKLSNNYFKSNYSYNWGGGVYLDAGSAYMEVFDNVFEDNIPWIEVQSPQYGTHDIKIYNNFSDTAERDRDERDSVKVEEPTIQADANWSGKAKEIIDNAGVRGAYRNLLTRSEFPQGRKLKMSSPRLSYVKDIPVSHGKIQAEDFMKGGDGVGYHKEFRPRPNNNKYRADSVSLVQVLDSTEGFTIDANGPGDWLKYEVDLEEDGEYYVDLKLLQNWTDGPVARVSVDDVDLGIVYTAPVNAYTLGTAGPIELKKGRHTITVEFLNSFYFDWLEIYKDGKHDTSPYLGYNLEECEDYDEIGIVYETKYEEEKQFEDINGHWAKNMILKLKNRGIIKGMSETEFAPENGITGYQAALISRRTFGITEETDGLEEKLIENGILNNSAQSENPVSREEFISIFMKVYIEKYKTYNVTYGTTTFKDLDRVDENLKDYMLAAYGLGFIRGDENGMLNPKDSITRAEAVSVIYNYLN